MLYRKIFCLSIIFIIIVSAFSIISNTTYFGNYFSTVTIVGGPGKIGLVDEINKVPSYSDLVIERMYLDNDNSTYAIRRGEFFENEKKLDRSNDAQKIERILQLALFYQWNKEEPLMFSSTLDTVKFDESLILLKWSEDEFIKKYPWADKFFPMSFLEKFVAASKKYKTFSNEISERNARDLFQSMEEADKAYREEVDDLKKMITKVAQEGDWGKKDYASLGGETYTNTDIILNDLEKMGQNSAILQEEIEKRKKCSLVSWEYCQRPLEGLVKPEFSLEQKDKIPKFFSKTELNFKDSINYFGPFEVNSPCWQKKDEQYLYVSKECPKNYCTETSYLATNSYFYEIARSHVPSDLHLKAQGVEIIPQGAANPYTCANMEYQPKVAALNYFYTEFKNDRFFQQLEERGDFNDQAEEMGKIIKEGEDAENLFFDSLYPSEYSWEYLGSFYGFYYSYLMKNNLGGKDQEQDKEKVLYRYLLIKEKLSDSDLVLNRFVHLFSHYTRLSSATIPQDETRFYAYVMRSGYSLLFFDFSPFVWKNPQKPQYLARWNNTDKEKMIIETGIIDYQTAISKYGKENVEKWVKIYNENIGNKLGNSSG